MAPGMGSLEGEYRLVRILKIKKAFYMIMVATIIFLMVVLMSLQNASLKPLFIPISTIAFFVMITLLGTMVASFFFRLLEIRYNSSGSRKFLMAKRYQSRTMAMIVFTALVGVILILPITGTATEDALQDSNIELNSSNDEHQFFSRDPFGLTTIKTITVTNPDQAHDVNVYIMEEEDYKVYKAGGPLGVALNAFESNISYGEPMVHSFNKESFGSYVVFIEFGSSLESKAKVSMDVTISQTFTIVVPLILFIMAGANAGFYVYMAPIKKKYASESIYT